MMRVFLLCLLVLLPTGFAWAGIVRLAACGPYDGGKKPSEVELKAMLGAHKAWVKAKPAALTWQDYIRQAGKDGRRANLCGADLRGALFLLKEANLSGADLMDAKLSAVSLPNADLSGADLTKADLTKAILERANLSEAKLTNADLSEAHLAQAKLISATLAGTHLHKAHLKQANLSFANLAGADMEKAELTEADLNQANLAHAHLARTVFDYQIGKTPEIPALALVLAENENLDQLEFPPGDKHKYSVPAITELRDAFKKQGFRKIERQMTFLLKQASEEDKDTHPLERWLSHALFNWTCRYGNAPHRCLMFLLVLTVVMSIPYLYALRRTDGDAGLWAVWASERTLKHQGGAEPVRLTFAQPFPLTTPPPPPNPLAPMCGLAPSHPAAEPSRPRRLLSQLLACLLAGWLALYFSLLSAFHFGWRDLNVGNWIARIQLHEYALRPTGWVRVVSGLQSLISVYLVALWVLSYFGRPFE